MKKVTCLTLFSVPLFICILFSNIFNYISIGSNNWITLKHVDESKNELVYQQYRLWDLSVTANSLIATGTALNILCLMLVIIFLALLCLRKKIIKVLLAVLLVCLLTCLLALFFNSVGWYYFLVSLKTDYMCVIEFGWGYWLMTPSFAFSVLAILLFALLIGILCPLIHAWWRGDLVLLRETARARYETSSKRRFSDDGIIKPPVYNITNHNNIIHRDRLTQAQLDGIKIDTKVDIPNASPSPVVKSRHYSSYDDYFNYYNRNLTIKRPKKLNFAVINEIPRDDSLRWNRDDHVHYSYRDEYFFDGRRDNYLP